MAITIEQQHWTHAGWIDNGSAGGRPRLDAIDPLAPAFEAMEGDSMVLLRDPAPTAVEFEALLSRVRALSIDMAEMAYRLEKGIDQAYASPALVLDAIAHGEASAKLAKALTLSLAARNQNKNVHEPFEMSAAA
jgi:hypothetical protein